MRIPSTSKYHPLHARRRKLSVPFGATRFLSVFEGFEGGFAIGASIVAALSFTINDRSVLLVTAIISIIVNGFNNASVKYSSEHYLDELDGKETPRPYRYYFVPALLEFVAYIAISFLSILPLIFISDLVTAVSVNITVTLVMLFVAGYWRAYMLRMPKLRDAFETMFIGAGIVVFGVIAGLTVHWIT
ncbi:MAG: VIT1/CCC1 transporter family protein [Candidatus Saccharimonas sp.]